MKAYLLLILKYCFWVVLISVSTLFPKNVANAEIDDPGPIIGLKSSLYSLKIGVRYLENRNNFELFSESIPLPLIDIDYFNYGDWAFYADYYLNNSMSRYLYPVNETVRMRPISFDSSQSPVIVKEICSNSAIVKVDYPRHKELERLLQKLYFNLMQGPVILTIAYNPESVSEGYEHFSYWNSYMIPEKSENGDSHLVYVNWNEVHSVVAYLYDGRIKLVDRGQVYDVCHNAIVAQVNALRSIPSRSNIEEKDRHLNFLLFYEKQEFKDDELALSDKQT